MSVFASLQDRCRAISFALVSKEQAIRNRRRRSQIQTEELEPRQLLTVPIANWGMNETTGNVVYDSTSNHSNATNHGATSDGGAIGNSLHFDGISTNVVASTSASIGGLSDFTVTARVRTTASKSQVIIQQRDSAGFNGEFQLNIREDGSLNFWLFGDDIIQFDIGTRDVINDGGWHYVAAGRNGRRGFIYLDGVLETETWGIIRNLNSSISIGIGADIRDSTDYFDGWIDEVSVYNIALPPAEIASDANIIVPQGEVRDSMPMFTWPKVANATSYKLWVQKMSGNGSPVINVSTTDNFYQPADNLTIGNYRTWVQATLQNGSRSTWQYQDFTFNGPVSFVPMNAKQPVSQPQLSWEEFPGADHYDLWVSNLTTGASQFVRQTNLTTTDWTSGTDMPMGRYQAWVRAFDAAGNASKWSAGLQFEVLTQATATSPAGSITSHTPLFSWPAVVGAASYQVWVNRVDVPTSQIINVSGIATNQYSAATNLPSGTYRYWIRAVSSEGHFGFWSAVSNFTIA